MFHVKQFFHAFQRDYKAGSVLTAADLACWPEDQADLQVKVLLAAGRIEPVAIGDPASALPKTWGSEAIAEAAKEPDAE